MLEERKAAINDDQVRDKFEHLTAETYLTVEEQVAYCDSTAGAFTVYLPPVVEAKGKIYVVGLLVDNGDLTIADLNDSRDWEGDYTLDDALEYKVFYSDGEKWHLIGAKNCVTGGKCYVERRSFKGWYQL